MKEKQEKETYSSSALCDVRVDDHKNEKFYVISGGTMNHVSPHFALCAPAFGTVGRKIKKALESALWMDTVDEYLDGNDKIDNVPSVSKEVIPIFTRMARGPDSISEPVKSIFEASGIKDLETNEDLKKLIDFLVSEKETRCIIMATAVCDWKPDSASLEDNSDGYSKNLRSSFGKDTPRFKSNHSLVIKLVPDEKIISSIRKKRKDIFCVAFKASAGLNKEECYREGLSLLKKHSCNLVMANDTQTHANVVVTPEEFPYYGNRNDCIRQLAEMTVARCNNTFKRTTVVEGDLVKPQELARKKSIPTNFIPVLKHVIDQGAFKPFDGKTTGHFGCKILSADIPRKRLSSVRKVNHNEVFENGMVVIEDAAGITAYGAKPSVGEHTQAAIYETLGQRVHSIIHFHCPLKENAVDGMSIGLASQIPFECGSDQCAINTCKYMAEVRPGIYCAMLIGHGPNIAFNKDSHFEKVIEFINDNFDLSGKTGGTV